MSDPTPACYRDRNNGVRYQRGIHHAACADPTCRGCRPCPERGHCQGKRGRCSWHVPDGVLTCGRCLAATRTDLHKIADLAALVPIAALDAGIDSEAANLAGPAADPEAWSWRKAAALAGGPWHLSLIEDDDEHHPLRVIGTWAHMIGDAYGHTPAGHLAAGVAYLDLMLHRIAQDPDQDFAQLATELRRCAQHLEVSIRNGAQIDRGAPCPECTSEETGVGPRLHRHWAATVSESWDEWRCPRVRAHRWSHHDYTRWIEQRRDKRTHGGA